MTFREARISDIQQIQLVRNAVKENRLSDPALVSDEDCEEYMTRRGKGWVCETESRIIGFAIADLAEHNIWALFLHPDFEKQGIGRTLHRLMLDWYFGATDHPVWLSTSPGTRAERFYKKAGWTEAGLHGKETRFEMSASDWARLKAGA